MSQFPNQLDSDTDLPRVDSNIVEIGPDAINALRDAMFAVEMNIGVNSQGSTGSISQRLSVSLNADGSIKPSSLTGIGLVTLPITDSEISSTAGIQESKLNLIFSTTSLFNLYTALKSSIDVLNGFLSLVGVQVAPHIAGTNYNHLLSHIHIDTVPSFVKTNPILGVQSSGISVINRDTTNADTLLQDLNNDLVVHEKADGSSGVTASSGGTVPPLNYAHNADGIFVNPNSFSVIPQTSNDVQKVIEFFDSSSLLLLGSRTQNLYANGIPRTSRSSVFTADGYGDPLVPPTPVISFHLNVPPLPGLTSPFDDINRGDDVVLFYPTTQQKTSFNFDAQFAQVRPGDILTIHYGADGYSDADGYADGYSSNVAARFTIDSTKTIINGVNRTYAVRISGKNLFGSATAIARIDKALFHRSKWGVLSTSRCPNSVGSLESLIVANPRSAMALGNGFNPSQFDATHYNLSLILLPTGEITNQIQLPAIDVTGNKGTTPGKYTLDSIIDATNTAFRVPGFNYRFVAFQYNGQFGIMLADPYNNASFSIISGSVDTNGNYTSTSISSFPNNVVDNFNGVDPLGFGLTGANIASPPVTVSYTSVLAAFLAPTLIFYPLTKSFFYTNGVERDRLKSDPIVINQTVDQFGDGYWVGTILPPPATQVLPNRVEVVYQVNLDLSTSGLAIGKTIVIQPFLLLTDAKYTSKDYGRFIIKNVVFNGCNTPNPQTNITVYDGVHGAGVSPFATSTGIQVKIYFDDDSVGFNTENVFDGNVVTPYKRFFEIYTDQNGHTFSHERARFLNIGSDIANINMYRVSPKLRGYNTVDNDREIRLLLTGYTSSTGIYDGYLARFNPSLFTLTNIGPTTSGKKGEIVRFYDETNIDFIDFTFNTNDAISDFTSKTIDIQLFNTLELDEEMMLISSCQVNDTTKQVSYLKDERQFGNTSEEQFTTSALDYISAPQKLLRENGVINGFEILSSSVGQVALNGGTVLVNGKIINVNNTVSNIPVLQETLFPTFTTNLNSITWFVCVNSKSEIEFVASTDYALSLSSTYGSLDHTRLFYVKNPNASPIPIYSIRATYFSDLILNHKDLTPIAIVSSTISGSPFTVTSSTISDARRFIANGYNGLTEPFVVGSESSFRSFNTVNTWLNQLLNFKSNTTTNSNFVGSKVIVKGNLTISSPITLTYNSLVEFKGDGAIINVSSSRGFMLGSNVKFKDIQFNYTNNPVGDGTYISSNIVNNPNGLIYSDITSTKNLSVEDCIFINTISDHYPFITINFPLITAIAQNISIKNNQFISQTSTNDIRASIAISSTLTPSGTPLENARLINTIIENNIGNQDQMIILTANSMIAPITCINTKISKNICGIIGFTSRFDYPQNYVNTDTNFIRNKAASLIIEENTTKFIGTLNSSGFTPQGSLFASNSGRTIIRNNICSWMQIDTTDPVSTDASRRASLTIDNNIFNAFDTAFLTSIRGSLGTVLNYAYADFGGFTTSGNVNNGTIEVIISNNIFNTGVGISSVSSTTIYNYLNHINTFNSIKVVNNIFDGIISDDGYSVFIQTNFDGYTDISSATITGNKFIRGSSVINAYIKNPFLGRGNFFITENIFDQSTIDGSNISLVSLGNAPVTGTVVYERNKNQIAYALISWFDSQTLVDYPSTGTISASPLVERTVSGGNLTPFDATNGFSMTSFQQAGDVFPSPSTHNGYGIYALVEDASDTAGYRHIIRFTNLNDYLPLGVTIQDVQMGTWIDASNTGSFDTTNSGDNYFSVSLARTLSAPSTNVLNIRDRVIVDVNLTGLAPGGFFPNPVQASINVTTGNQASFATATQYVDLNLLSYGMSGDVTELFKIGSLYSIDLTMEFQFIATTPGTNALVFWVSPALVQYIW